MTMRLFRIEIANVKEGSDNGGKREYLSSEVRRKNHYWSIYLERFFLSVFREKINLKHGCKICLCVESIYYA